MQNNLQTRVGLVLVFLVILVCVTYMASKERMAARAVEDRVACIANLKKIEAGYLEWASENKERAGGVIDTNEVNEVIQFLKGKKMSKCPSNGAYWIDKSGQPICSLGEGLGHVLKKE